MMPAARAHAATAPKRMVCVYSPNGVNVWQWFPKTPPTGAAAFEFSPTLEPLAGLRDKLTVIAGLHHPRMKLAEGHNGANTWLTGADVAAMPGVEFLNTVSADQLAAGLLGKDTRFPSLELAAEPGGGGAGGRARTLAWSRNGVALPSEGNLPRIYQKLFGPEAEADAAERKRRQVRQKNLLDTVLGSANRLRARLGRNDQQKLDEYLHSVRDIEQRVQRAEAWNDRPKPSAKLEPKNEHNLASEPSDCLDYFPVLYDLMFLALQTDSTRVITMMTGSEGNGITLRERGISRFHHSLSHHNHDPESLRDLATTDHFLVAEHAKFLRRLAATREGDATLLDRTLVLYGSGMSDAHNTRHLPIVLAGGSALGLRHRTWLDLSKGGTPMHIDRGFSVAVNDRARLANLLLTMLQRLDVGAASFADSTGIVSELLA